MYDSNSSSAIIAVLIPRAVSMADMSSFAVA